MARFEDLKDGDPIEYRTSEGWFLGEFHGEIIAGHRKTAYVRIKRKGYKLYSYTAAGDARRVKPLIEDGNPNRTFKSRK